MNEIRIGIAGATGYTGIELIRLLARHPKARIVYLTSESHSGMLIDSVYPHLSGISKVQLELFDPTFAAAKCDLLFLARGNGWAMRYARAILDAGCKVIDLAADFRLNDPVMWQMYYGVEHEATDLLREAVYGLPELHRDPISNARLVANPGCYPTSAILALAPAVAGRWIEPDGIAICSASGVSGAGRSRMEVPYLFTEVNENYRAYNVTKHRHTPEIEQELSALAGEEIKVTFTPHLAPITRGIHTTVYAEMSPEVDQDCITQAYQDFYSGSPFVRVLDSGELPEIKHVTGSNKACIAPIVMERTGRLVVLCVIDNLIKGASGQAIQSMNLMFGQDETSGLEITGVYP